jgi:hypothetical protein
MNRFLLFLLAPTTLALTIATPFMPRHQERPAAKVQYTVTEVEEKEKDALEAKYFPRREGAYREFRRNPGSSPYHPLPGDNLAWPRGGNSAGVVVGASYKDKSPKAIKGGGIIVTDDMYHPVLWKSPGAAPTLLTLPSDCNRGLATAINTEGRILGSVGYLIKASAP